jgi:hypothetical protein
MNLFNVLLNQNYLRTKDKPRTDNMVKTLMHINEIIYNIVLKFRLKDNVSMREHNLIILFLLLIYLKLFGINNKKY